MLYDIKKLFGLLKDANKTVLVSLALLMGGAVLPWFKVTDVRHLNWVSETFNINVALRHTVLPGNFYWGKVFIVATAIVFACWFFMGVVGEKIKHRLRNTLLLASVMGTLALFQSMGVLVSYSWASLSPRPGLLLAWLGNILMYVATVREMKEDTR